MRATGPHAPRSGSGLLPTGDTGESHPVAFLRQVQPPRHLVDHHLDLVFIQRTGNGHTRAEMLRETGRTLTPFSTVLTLRSWRGNGPQNDRLFSKSHSAMGSQALGLTLSRMFTGERSIPCCFAGTCGGKGTGGWPTLSGLSS